jgi:transcriptional regulator of heat shock response
MDTEDGDMFIPKYNNNNKKYDGDYSFDKDSCSLIIYDNSEKSVKNEVLRNDGTIRIPIYITDNETIKTNTVNGVNVLSISDDYLNIISPSEISMTENSTCKLPPSVKFGEITTNLNIIGEESGDYNFKYNSTEKTLSLSPIKTQSQISIESGDGITISETTTDGVTNYKIKWNPPSNATSNATSAISVSDEIQDLYTGSIQLSTVNYLKKTESLTLSNNTIDKTLDDLSFIPSHANSIILQITTSKDNITRIRHMKSTGVLLSQVPANSEQQIYTLEVPFIIE